MKNQLRLTPVKMDEKIMIELEDKGLIERIVPSRDKHRINVATDEGKGQPIYTSPTCSGGHALVAVAIDNEKFYSFATHNENEEFLLLGGINERPMYLLISLLSRDVLLEKLCDCTLSNDDFVLLDVVFNNPQVSFFVMKKGVPHGECAYGNGRPTTFYVTECSGISLDKIDLYEKYDLIIGE